MIEIYLLQIYQLIQCYPSRNRASTQGRRQTNSATTSTSELEKDIHQTSLEDATTIPVISLTDQLVAMKVIDLKGLKDSVARQMLDSEISILKNLKHPNILLCYDVLKTANHCYIVTELCSSGDLASQLKSKVRFTQSQSINYFKGIMNGFKQIASKNILHRDLKPANIFLSEGICKIADFGFAKKNTTPGVRQKYNVGSPLYMSPQSLKRNIYSTKNDIWSLGIILFQMLYGRTPWQCKSQKELIQKITRIPVAFPISPKISQDIKMLIKKCLQVDESNRFGVDDIMNSAPLKNAVYCDSSQHILPQVRVLQERSQNVQRRERSVDNGSYKNSTNNSVTQRPKYLSKQNKKVDKDNDIKKAVQKINVCRLIFKLKEQLGDDSCLAPQLRMQLTNRISQLKKQHHSSRVRKVIEEYYVKYTNNSNGKHSYKVQGFQQKAVQNIWSQNQWCKQLMTMFLCFKRGVNEGLSQVLQKAKKLSDQELRAKLVKIGIKLQ